MNYKRGFGAIAVLVGVLVVVGVGLIAYSIGKHSNTPVDNSQINNPVVNPNGNTAVDNNTVVDNGNGNGCNKNSAPSITVLSPNGGEVYKIGQKITITWKTCNADAGQTVSLSIGKLIPPSQNNGISGAWKPSVQFYPLKTANDGSETVTLGSASTNGNWPFVPGNSFEVSAVLNPLPTNTQETPFVQDASDSTFTINNKEALSYSCPAITVSGGAYPGSTPVSTTRYIQVISPNGGETYHVGDTMNIEWKDCNMPASETIGIDLMDANHSSDAAYLPIANQIPITAGSYKFIIPASINAYGTSIALGGTNSYKLSINNFITGGDGGNSDLSDNTFTIKSHSLSTALPEYVGGKDWPPVIQHSSTAYSCTLAHSEMSDTIEKVIGTRTYCITSVGDDYTSHHVSTYTYTTAASHGNGTETTTFTLTYVACGVYGSPTDPTVIQCNSNQTTFSNNLDALIDSLM